MAVNPDVSYRSKLLHPCTTLVAPIISPYAPADTPPQDAFEAGFAQLWAQAQLPGLS
jgi:hypothetical protein